MLKCNLLSADSLAGCQEEEEDEEEEEEEEDDDYDNRDEVLVEEQEPDMQSEHRGDEVVQMEQTDEDDEDDEEINETSRLCPPKSEIIISPMTLSYPSSREVYSETINMTHLKPNHRNVKEDV